MDVISRKGDSVAVIGRRQPRRSYDRLATGCLACMLFIEQKSLAELRISVVVRMKFCPQVVGV